MNRAELDHETERTRLEEALAAAKAACAEGHTEDNLVDLAAAAQAIAQFRIDEAPPVDASPGDGVAAPDPVTVTTEGG